MKSDREIDRELIALTRAHLDGLYDPATHRIDVSPRLGNRDSYVYAMCLLSQADPKEQSDADYQIFIEASVLYLLKICILNIKAIEGVSFGSIRPRLRLSLHPFRKHHNLFPYPCQQSIDQNEDQSPH